MATVAQPTYGTVLGGAVSIVEAQSQYLRNQTWMDEVLYNTQKPPSFAELLVLTGMMKSSGTTKLPTWHHIEKDQYRNMVGVNSQLQPAIGATITLTVANAYYNAAGESTVYENTLWRFPDGTCGFCPVGNVTPTPGATTIELELFNTQQFPAVAQGTVLICLGTSVGQSAEPNPDFLVTDVAAYDHNTQVFDFATSVTDFFEAYDQNGKFTVAVTDLPAPWVNGSVKTWNSLMLQDWYTSKMMHFNSALLLGPRKTQGGVAALSDARYLDGIIPFIQAGGNNFITPAVMAVTDLELIAEAFIDAAQGEKAHDMYCGRNYWNNMNNMLLALPGQTERQGEGNTFYQMAYKGINGIGGHDFKFTLVDDFTSPLAGLRDQGFADVCLFIPRSTEVDTVSGKRVPCMQVKWQDAWSGFSGAIGSGMWKWGMRKGLSFCATGETPTYGPDELRIEMKGTVGTDLRIPARFGISQ